MLHPPFHRQLKDGASLEVGTLRNQPKHLLYTYLCVYIYPKYRKNSQEQIEMPVALKLSLAALREVDKYGFRIFIDAHLIRLGLCGVEDKRH